jgi:hypothetical protein
MTYYRDHSPDRHDAIVPAVARELATSGGLDGKPNHLAYPGSKWDNLRTGTI